MSRRRKGGSSARPYEYVSVGIRLTGDLDKVNKLIERLRIVAHVNDPSVPYENDKSPYGVDVYLRAYLYSGLAGETLYDQLECAKEEIRQLEAELGEAYLKIEDLNKKWDNTPKPRPYDAVLSPSSYDDFDVIYLE